MTSLTNNNNPPKTMDSHIPVPKQEEKPNEPLLDPIPDPQPRDPRVSAQQYQDIIGEGHKVIYKLPSSGRSHWDPIKRKPNEQSQYNEKLWPPSARQVDEQMNKKHSESQFLLNNEEMGDLAYIVGPRYGPGARYQDHAYLAVQLERRAWEIYGGPEGYQFAKQKHDEAARHRKPRQRRRNATVPSCRYTPYNRRFDPILAMVGDICQSCDYD